MGSSLAHYSKGKNSEFGFSIESLLYQKHSALSASLLVSRSSEPLGIHNFTFSDFSPPPLPHLPRSPSFMFSIRSGRSSSHSAHSCIFGIVQMVIIPYPYALEHSNLKTESSNNSALPSASSDCRFFAAEQIEIIVPLP